MPDGPPPRSPPAWLSPSALAAAQAARRRQDEFPPVAGGDAKTVREVILAHHPALPLTLIAEAVAFVLGSE